jgi:hypothetical protein
MRERLARDSEALTGGLSVLNRPKTAAFPILTWEKTEHIMAGTPDCRYTLPL